MATKIPDMPDKSTIRSTVRAFAHILQHYYRGAVYIGHNHIIGTTLFEKPLIVDHRDAQSLRLIYSPPKSEQELLALLYHLIQPGMRCIDIGSGCGYYAVTLAFLAGPTGQIYSFDNKPDFSAVLQRNIAMNHLNNVTSDTQTTTLDAYFTAETANLNFIHIASHCDLYSTFAGMRHCVASSHPIYILCHCDPAHMEQHPQDYQRFFSEITELGFEGILCSTLESLHSDEQLMQSRSRKSLLFSRTRVYTEER